LAENKLLVPKTTTDTTKEPAIKKDVKSKKVTAKKPVAKKTTPKTSKVKGGAKTATPSKKGK
jgi:hypothetical protein